MKKIDLNDFYLLKAFPHSTYRDDFNTGKSIHMWSTAHYHKLEDEFQKDFEGGIFKQNLEGKLILSNNDIPIKDLVRQSLNPKIKDLFINTNDFRMYIDGYISCFTLLPKMFIRFIDGKFVFHKDSKYQEILKKCLYMYARETGYSYLSIYEAQELIDLLAHHLKSKSLSVMHGIVKYEQNYSEKTRVNYFKNKQFDRLIFTKDKKYEYQHEFRIFIHKFYEPQKESIILDGVDLSKSHILDAVYLTPEYYSNLKKA